MKPESFGKVSLYVLVRETFDYKFTFQHSGLAKAPRGVQLKVWKNSLAAHGLKVWRTPATWLNAFEMLKDLIIQSEDKKKVIFLDNLPWMDTLACGLIPALEHFWNSWASARKDVLLIISGSATSWIINKIVKNKGGLYNRVDNKIPLSQFILSECEQYMKSCNINMSRKQIAEGYMIIGRCPILLEVRTKGAEPDPEY